MEIQEITTINNRKEIINTVSGDFNLLNPMFSDLKRQYNRKKQSYIFAVNYNGKFYYDFALSKDEYWKVRKIIPEIDK